MSKEFEQRKCPYCGKKLDRPYWRHIQSKHPKEFETSTQTWAQLFKDYSTMGMGENISIKAIAELFNKSEEEVRDFLKMKGLVK